LLPTKGGTGQAGSECVYQALQGGHKVKVLARDPSKMLVPLGSGGAKVGTALTDSNLEVLQGSVTDQKAVDKVFDACETVDGVIVALGGTIFPMLLMHLTENMIIYSWSRKNQRCW
jgi:nucleoside-diphosphate-sugar epimerase